MREVTTTDIAKFGARERRELIELLTAWQEQGLPEDFCDDEVVPMMNMDSGYVFLTAGMRDSKRTWSTNRKTRNAPATCARSACCPMKRKTLPEFITWIPHPHPVGNPDLKGDPMVYDSLDMRFIEAMGRRINARLEEAGVYLPVPFPLENAVEVITSDCEEWQAVTWLYEIGAVAAGDLCYESYADAHGIPYQQAGAIATAVILVKGGCVQDVLIDSQVNLILCDYDTDGVDPDKLKQAPSNRPAWITRQHVTCNPGMVAQFDELLPR